MNLSLKSFYFIRHGETDWNREHRIMGSKDIPLNTVGIQQAHDAAQLLKTFDIATIVSSPLQRARLTADIIAQHINKPVITIDELKEACFGVAEGKQKSGENRTLLKRWENGDSFEGAEYPACFAQRVFSAVNQALQHPGPVLIVAHGGQYHFLQKMLTNNNSTILNTAIVEFIPPCEINPSWSIRFFNDAEADF